MDESPPQLSRDHVNHIIFKMLNAVEAITSDGLDSCRFKASHFLLDGSTCNAN